jgi:hypothetical protein
MDLKVAKNEHQSSTLNAANRSNLMIYGLLIGVFIGAIAWYAAPKEIKDKITPAVLAGSGAVGFVLKNFNASIKNGRLSVGDLEEAVKSYALLSTHEAKVLDSLKPVIEGHLSVIDLPQVKREIEQQVKAKLDELMPTQLLSNITEGVALPPIEMGREDMHRQVATVARAQTKNIFKNPQDAI